MKSLGSPRSPNLKKEKKKNQGGLAQLIEQRMNVSVVNPLLPCLIPTDRRKKNTAKRKSMAFLPSCFLQDLKQLLNL